MELIRYPNPILNEKSKPVKQEDLDAVRGVIPDMVDLMHKYNGVGLAAVQAGMLKRFAILNMKADPYYDPSTPEVIVMINPQSDVLFELAAPEVRVSEGCLSLPLLSEVVERASKVKITYMDENWQEVTREFTGIIAQCIQHEIEHMDGQLLIDRLSVMKKQMYVKKLKKRGAL